MRDIWARVADLANGDSAAVQIPISWGADDRPWDRVEYASQSRRSLLTASTKFAVVTAANLIALRRVDTPQSGACAADFDRIAVDHTGAANDIVSRRRS
jgi:hypothetical protein